MAWLGVGALGVLIAAFPPRMVVTAGDAVAAGPFQIRAAGLASTGGEGLAPDDRAHRRRAAAFHTRAHQLTTEGRHQEAVEHLREATWLVPDDVGYQLALARALGRLTHWTQAVEAYQVAISLDSTRAVLHEELGRALQTRGNHPQAIDALRNAVALDPRAHEAYRSLAVSFEALRLWEDALAAYEAYLEVAPPLARAEAVQWHIDTLLDRGLRPSPGRRVTTAAGG